MHIQENKPSRHFWVRSLVVSILIVLFGYSGLFTGKTFFIHEDWVALSNHTSGNKDSNGWRADKGLGLSYFYGDPGLWHPWAIFSFLERIVPSREIAYQASIVFLDLSAVMVVCLFAQRFLGPVNPWVVTMLAPLLVFCFNAPAEHYSREFISVTIAFPLMLWLLYVYLQSPRWIHVFLFALLVWGVAFLGNLWSMTQVLMAGFVFSVLYWIYHKNFSKKELGKFVVIYAAGLLMVLLLGAWVFYSFGLEQSVVGYVREKTIAFPGLKWIPEVKPLISYLAGFIPFEMISINHNLAAMYYLPYRLSGSVIFIFCFLFFLGRKSRSFWEYALKGLMIVYFAHGLLVYGKLIPAISTMYSWVTSKTSTLITMYLFVFSIQALMIIQFVSALHADTVLQINHWCRKLQVVIAAVTVGCYLAAMSLCVCAKLLPGLYSWLSDHYLPSLIPEQLGGYSKELLSYMLSYNAHRYQELIRPQWFLFFATSILIAGVFIRDKWLKAVASLPKVVIAGVLIFNAIMLTWNFYPLSDKPLVWERPEVRSLKFEPTDRFYFVRYLQWEKTVDGFKKKWETAENNGPRKNLVGYLEPPGLNISGFKSFTNRAEAEFMQKIFSEAGYDYKRLYYGTHFVSSPLLDMAAVNYYFSDNVIDDLPKEIVPYAQFEQLYIYKNTAAWSYYYLADRLKSFEGSLSSPVKNTAYLSSNDLFEFPSKRDGKIELKEFHYGRMIFDYRGLSENFLVIADAWHPFWKARSSSGEELKVFKTNEVFKGVRLPAGNYQVEVYFDTQPYRPGVWISVIAWVLWIGGCLWALRSRKEMGWLN